MHRAGPDRVPSCPRQYGFLGRMTVVIVTGHMVSRLIVAHAAHWWHYVGGVRWLKRHSAYRAFSGMRFPDVRMHRTGPNGSGRGRMLIALLLYF
ncbi:hypothetical protein AD945_01380 [Gluconobacter albidus]|uniref:Uncharacterized protein n=1 Tax=Gluconobacter albidus TaxID=318683 RepID=A0A149TN53_9PROT|nr:hypothetical protein AD945_01380 [Gluconobacter albidus]